MCNTCERFARKYAGGAEVELTILFADVRGSTRRAEDMSPSDFRDLINRFYRSATHELFRRNAFVEKLVGDAVTALFVPGFAGEAHARVGARAAIAVLRSTGHAQPGGPWIPVGVGVHTGCAFVGATTTEGGLADITALGDDVNTAARLASVAEEGEVVLSDATVEAAGLPRHEMRPERRELRGRTEPIDTWTMRVTAAGGP
jgi:adenylate cyclase